MRICYFFIAQSIVTIGFEKLSESNKFSIVMQVVSISFKRSVISQFVRIEKPNITASNVGNFCAIAYCANLRVIKQIAQVILGDRRRTCGAFASIGNGRRQEGRQLGGFSA